MSRLIRTISLAALVMLGVIPVHAWWGQNNGAGENPRGNSDTRGYGQRGYTAYGEDWKPWKDGMWKNWRAPWSHDGSRWGAGPWNSFGESFGDLMGEVEVDTNVRVKGKASGSGENGAKTWNYGYSNSYRGYQPPPAYRPAPYPYAPYGPYPYYQPPVMPYAPYPPQH